MKYALVTGGSRGIGKAVCGKLAKMGYHILVNYVNNTEAANAVVSEIQNEGGHATPLQFDVSNKENTKEVIGAWLTQNKTYNYFKDIQ